MDTKERRYEGQEFDLMEYWRVIVKRRGVLFVFAGTVIILIGIYSFTAKPKYEPSATLLMGDETSRILSLDDEFGLLGYRSQMQDEVFLNTQLTLLASKSLAERVARKLELLSRSEFDPELSSKSIVSKLKNFMTFKWLRANKTNEEVGELLIDPYIDIVEDLQTKLHVSQIRETKVFKIGYTTLYPILGTEIVNTFAEEFINFSIEKRYETTQQATNFLNEQIVNLRRNLAVKERELQRYGKEKDLFFLNETESMAMSELRNLTNAFSKVKIERIDAEAFYRALRDSNVDSLQRTAANQIIQNLEEEYSRMRNEYQENLRRFKPDHPTMKQLESKIESMRGELNNEVDKAVMLAETKYREALREEALLNEQLVRQREQVAEMDSNAILYNSLQIETENLHNQLSALEEKKNETEVSSRLGGLKTSNISIVDRAMPPKYPVSPKKMLNLVLALFMGVFGGVGLCFLFEYMDNTVKNPEDVEKMSGLPSLGVIPYIPPEGVGKRKRNKYYFSYRDTYGEDTTEGEDSYADINKVELVNHIHPKFSISEDYRTIRTSIVLSQVDIGSRILAFVSVLPSEGKTATLANIAVAFAQLEKRVLIIDADMRKPSLHRLFEVDNKKGLSGYLSGGVSIEESISKTKIENIWILPSGVVPPNPAELLDSDRMKLFIVELKKGFDYVLIDTPPVLPVVDSLVLSAIVNGVVIVVEPGRITRKLFMKGVEDIRQSRAKILGIVYNKVELSGRGSYFHGYYRYYYKEPDDSSRV
ncbi:GumC family protein [Acidobacteriota bacterium]